MKYNNDFSISRIEDDIFQMLRSTGISDIFVSTYPSSFTNSNMNYFAVIDVAGGIRDRQGIATGTLVIEIYVRPMQNNIKNWTIFNLMEQKINSMLNSQSYDTALFLSKEIVQTGYDTSINWHKQTYTFSIKLIK